MKTSAGRPASEILAHSETTTGLSETTARAVHRELMERDLLERSRGGKAQALHGSGDAALLLFGACVASEEPVRTVSKWAPLYCLARNENGERAIDAVANMIDAAAGAEALIVNGDKGDGSLVKLLNATVEVDIGFPRVAIRTQDADGEPSESVFCAAREKASELIAVRSVRIISGSVLFRLGLGLHYGKWSND